MIFPINYDINATLNMPDIMRQCQQQHGTDGVVGSIIEFCCDTGEAGFEFEDKLIAALTKFKADNQ